MWWFVGAFYACYFGLAGLFWGDLQSSEAPFVPWLITGCMGSVFIAIVLGIIANRKDALNWRTRK